VIGPDRREATFGPKNQPGHDEIADIEDPTNGSKAQLKKIVRKKKKAERSSGRCPKTEGIRPS